MLILNSITLTFVINLFLCGIAGFFIGIERESRGKVAGISTQSFVIAGAMLFTMLSLLVDPNEPARVAAQIVTGVGFLGAGIIIREESNKKKAKITNLTTAASIWFSASIGMSFGFGWYIIGIIATVYSIVVPRFPHLSPPKHHDK